MTLQDSSAGAGQRKRRDRPFSRLPALRGSVIVAASAFILTGADPFWSNKPVSAWTDDDDHQIVTDSPWARQVQAIICALQTEDQMRDGGNMGLPQGVGYDGLPDDRPRPRFSLSPLAVFIPDRVVPTPRPTITLQLRWESALPIRAAEQKSHLFQPLASVGSPDGYAIAVYGVPPTTVEGESKYLAKPLKGQAFLRRLGKRAVPPRRVEVLQPAGALVVVYVFPLSAEIVPGDHSVVFTARIGRLAIEREFQVDAMRFQGALEL